MSIVTFFGSYVLTQKHFCLEVPTQYLLYNKIPIKIATSEENKIYLDNKKT